MSIVAEALKRTQTNIEEKKKSQSSKKSIDAQTVSDTAVSKTAGVFNDKVFWSKYLLFIACVLFLLTIASLLVHSSLFRGPIAVKIVQPNASVSPIGSVAHEAASHANTIQADVAKNLASLNDNVALNHPVVATSVQPQPILTPEVKASNVPFSLNGIMMMAGQRVALINDNMYKVGDKIDGNQIVSIEFNEVTFKNKGHEFSLQAN